MSGFDIRLVFTLYPRDTAVQKIGYTSDIAFFAFQPGTNLIESDFCSRTAELEISIALFTCSLKKGCFEKATGDLSIQTFFSQTLRPLICSYLQLELSQEIHPSKKNKRSIVSVFRAGFLIL